MQYWLCFRFDLCIQNKRVGTKRVGLILEICNDKDALANESLEFAKKIATYNRDHLSLLKSLILDNKNHSVNLKKELNASINALKSLD